jgi:hypothetical protein
MSAPGSTPPGFTAYGGLLLRCPACGSAARSIDGNLYECGPGHRFLGGRCDECQAPAVEWASVWTCTRPGCVQQRSL